MASQVEICNMALYLLGDQPITAMDDDNDRARLCSAFYDTSRDATLRAADWNFATARDELSEDATPPENGYDHQFILPTDPYCLRVIELNDDPEAEWVVEGRRLLTDETEAIIKFIKQVTTPTTFDSLFVKAFSAMLAMDLAIPLTKSDKKFESMAKIFEYWITEAKGMSLHERGKIPDPTVDLISVR